ncbi:TonB-dependent receptor domain-containing protein [Ferrimonas lipolytica]|uniref:TonB-dependent receptor n=1 Tax=Ferrimonas lipolytica TaxID=2724191 RepID=A0A6H1UD33_9GAMM|nr:TonB-dependent receptor [Ferrimonas lipolytica]QIZ76263.1 TonB-dependent receptor [Ferrimonas lipolytica]
MSLKTRISVVALAIASSTAVAADFDDVMVVTGDRFESSAEYQLAVVNVIDRAEIDQISPKSVTELLQTVPGVSVQSNGGAGTQSSISIRGTGSTHALVLVDGVRISSATLGSVSFSSLSPEQIERIEIVKGPRAAVWGSDAIGGVVQIFTRKLDQGDWYAAAEVGSDSYLRTSAGIGIGNSSLTINRETSDGYDVKDDSESDDDGYERLSVALRGDQAINDQFSLSWVGQLNDGDYDYDNVYSDWMTGELIQGHNESEYKNHMWNLAGQYQTELWTSRLEVAQARDFNEQVINGNKSLGTNIYETRRDQISWSNQVNLAQLTLNGGVDWYNESVKGDYAVDERDVWGVFGLARYDVGAWLLEAAIRYDDVEKIDSEVTYNSSIAYRFDDQWRLTGSYGTGFRAPSFNDLYWPFSGNPDLVSENSDNYELGLHYGGNNVAGYISVFYNQIEDMIAWAPDASGNWLPANINEAEILGAELFVEFSTYGFNHKVAYTYLDAEDSKANEELIGRSEHEFDYSVGYNWDKFDVLLSYHLQGESYNGYDEYLDTYHDVDLSVGYAFANNWEVRAKFDNLLDEEIISKADYFEPGTQWFVSLTYKGF